MNDNQETVLLNLEDVPCVKMNEHAVSLEGKRRASIGLLTKKGSVGDFGLGIGDVMGSLEGFLEVSSIESWNFGWKLFRTS